MQLAQTRAWWEAARRAGRGKAAYITVDSWRDGDGVLWTPNFKVDVDAPNLKIGSGSPGVIGEVTYLRDERGTRAELTGMPGYAFLPEPIQLQPEQPDIPALAPPS